MSRRLIVAGVLLVVAGLLSWATGLDLVLHPMLRLSPASPLLWPVAHVTNLGGFLVMAPLALLVTIALLVRGRRDAALWLFVTVASGRLVVEGLKLIVMRARPPLADHLERVTSWSFPSSHSAGTMLTCLALALVSGRRGPPFVAIACAVLIGWTRVALGVHWPGDVLAGWGFALLWLGLAMRFARARNG